MEALAVKDPKILLSEFYNAGAKHFDAGDMEAARDQFQRALAVAPDHARSHYQLAMCLINTGDSAGAKKHFQRFLELAPDDSEAATAKEMLSFLE